MVKNKTKQNKKTTCQCRTLKRCCGVKFLGQKDSLEEKGRAGYPVQYSCLENPMDREVRQATVQVHRVSKIQTQLK